MCFEESVGAVHMNILRIMGEESEDEGGGKRPMFSRTGTKCPWVSVLGEMGLCPCVSRAIVGWQGNDGIEGGKEGGMKDN